MYCNVWPRVRYLLENIVMFCNVYFVGSNPGHCLYCNLVRYFVRFYIVMIDSGQRLYCNHMIFFLKFNIVKFPFQGHVFNVCSIMACIVMYCKDYCMAVFGQVNDCMLIRQGHKKRCKYSALH